MTTELALITALTALQVCFACAIRTEIRSGDFNPRSTVSPIVMLVMRQTYDIIILNLMACFIQCHEFLLLYYCMNEVAEQWSNRRLKTVVYVFCKRHTFGVSTCH